MKKVQDFVSNIAAIVLFVLFVCSISVPVRADDSRNFILRSCNEYASGKAFVKKAVVRCLQVRDSRRCERMAEAFFNQCGFDGNYSEISDKMRSDLLMLIVLQSAPTLKTSGERKRL